MKTIGGILLIILLVMVGCKASVPTSRDVSISEIDTTRPHSPSTNFRYALARDQFVTITIHDTSGAEVEMLANETQQAGDHTIYPKCVACPSGLYFFRFKGEDTTYVKKFILLK
jgi:hypothetical protein